MTFTFTFYKSTKFPPSFQAGPSQAHVPCPRGPFSGTLAETEKPQVRDGSRLPVSVPTLLGVRLGSKVSSTPALMTSSASRAAVGPGGFFHAPGCLLFVATRIRPQGGDCGPWGPEGRRTAHSLFPPAAPDRMQVMRFSGHSEGGDQNIKREVCARHTVCVCVCVCV